MGLTIYAAIVIYKGSKKAYVYLSAAHDAKEALGIAITATGRAPNIDTEASYAAPWPRGAMMPRTEGIIARGTPHAFKIQAPTYAESVLAGLGHSDTQRGDIAAHENRPRRPAALGARVTPRRDE